MCTGNDWTIKQIGIKTNMLIYIQGLYTKPANSKNKKMLM